MTKITINREIWLRGDSFGYLLNHEGMMCCIGQACEQLGVPRELLLDNQSVDDLIALEVEAPDPFLDEEGGDQNEDVLTAYFINDDIATTDAEKEAALVPVFAKMGLDLEFIN